MAISKDKKVKLLKELKEAIKEAKAIYFAKNLGLSVKDSQDMRRKFLDAGDRFKVAKKTLFKLAVKEELNVDIDDEALDGSAGAAFSFIDEVSAIKILSKVAKDTKKIEITGGIFEGRVIAKDKAITLSEIPPKEVLLAKFLGSLNAPIAGFVSVGNNVLSSFVRVINGYREKQESA